MTRWVSTRNGWWTRSRRGRCCSSPPTTIAWCHRTESEALFARAGEPKKLVVLHGWGHYEVYTGEAFRQVMAETLAWYRMHLPSR